MKRTLVTPNIYEYPQLLWDYLVDCDVYDSSCSPEARVLFADKEGGYYIKSAPIGTLEVEASLTDFFNKKGLATKVLALAHNDKDYMVTRAVKGRIVPLRHILTIPKDCAGF